MTWAKPTLQDVSCNIDPSGEFEWGCSLVRTMRILDDSGIQTFRDSLAQLVPSSAGTVLLICQFLVSNSSDGEPQVPYFGHPGTNRLSLIRSSKEVIFFFLEWRWRESYPCRTAPCGCSIFGTLHARGVAYRGLFACQWVFVFHCVFLLRPPPSFGIVKWPRNGVIIE